MTALEPTAGMLSDALIRTAPAEGVMSPVMDDWTPAPEPVEENPEEGVHHAAHAPVSAAAVSADQRGHLNYLDPWHHLTRGQQDEHRQACEVGCELCEGHRSFCFQCGHDVDTDDEYCGSCGEHWPNSDDFSDVKAAER